MDSERSHYLLSFLWLAAFILSLPVIEPEEPARLASLLLAFLVSFLMIGRALQAGIRLSGTALLDVAFLFWLLLFASLFWSVAFNISFIAFCTFSLLPLGFYAFALSKQTPQIAGPVFKGVIAVVTVLALGAAVQYFFLPDMLVNGGVREPFANPNSYAALLSLGFFIILGHLCTAEEARAKAVYTACAALVLAGLLIIGSRAVLLFLIPALILFVLLARGQIKKLRLSLTVIVLAALFTMALTVFAAEGRYTPVDRVVTLAGGEYNSIDARLDIWRATWAMIKDLPWYGTGLGTFFLYYPEYRLDMETVSSGLMAHNDLLQFRAEAGAVAPLLFYLFIVLAIWRMVKAKKEGHAQEQPMPAALFCGLGAMLLHSHVSFNLYVAPLLLLSGLMLGHWFFLTAPVRGDSEVRLPQRWPLSLRWGVVMAPFIVAGVILQGFMLSEYYANRAKNLAENSRVEQFAEAVNKANRAGFQINARPYIYAATIPLSVLEAGPLTLLMDGELLGQEERSAQIDKAESMLGKAEHYNPRLVAIYFYKAQARQYAGDKEQAIAILQKALKVDPLHIPSRQKLAGLYLENGEKEKALEVLKAGLHWPPRLHDPAAYYDLTSRLARELGDQETVSEVLSRIADYKGKQQAFNAGPDREPEAVFDGE